MIKELICINKAMNDYLIIRAPFNGIIAERNVDPGSYVGPMGKGSDKPLLVLQDNKKLRVSLSIPEKSIFTSSDAGFG